MKFLTLFKKEWRESAPFIMAALLALAVLGFGFVRSTAPWMAAGVFDENNYHGREIHYLALHHTVLVRCGTCGKQRSLTPSSCVHCTVGLPRPQPEHTILIPA